MAIIILSVIFNWAVREDLIKANPCKGVKVGAHGQRDTILEDASDYGRLFKTLDQMEEERRVRSEAADAIRLIALTGMRRGEAAGLRWRHVQGARIELHADEHKTGKKTGKKRIISLPAAAREIIARQPEREPDDFVFVPARGDGGQIELSHIWTKIRDEAGLDPKLTLHGLRHSTASHMAMAGAETGQIMATLGHSQASTTMRYIHFAKSAREALAEQAAAVALEGMKGSTKVVRLRKRG
jgi:integrase